MQKPHYITVKEFLVDSPELEPKGIFLLAHGAGKGMSSPFMSSIAKGIAAAGVRVVLFGHFPWSGLVDPCAVADIPVDCIQGFPRPGGKCPQNV